MSNSGYLVLQGSDDYISTSYTGVSGNASRTVCAWVYWNSTKNSCILDYGDSGISHFRFIIINSSNKLRVASHVGLIDSVDIIPTNIWTFVAVAFDTSDDTAYLYIDAGVANNSGALSALASDGSSDPVVMGVSTVLSSDFEGNFSDVMFFDEYLTQSDIQEIYDLGRNPNNNQVSDLSTYDNLISWWPFTVDASDKKGLNHGVIQGDAYVHIESPLPEIGVLSKMFDTDAASMTNMQLNLDNWYVFGEIKEQL
ncbi:MAG: LamG domain-containing protein [Candidatus Asgardarchaeia archaeon]